MSPISAYAAFVQKYDLSEILADNDFRVTATGGIEMWAGSAKQGDVRCNAMLRLLNRWFANTRVLETLLDLVGVDNFRKHVALSDLDAVAESAANGGDVEGYHALISRRSNRGVWGCCLRWRGNGRLEQLAPTIQEEFARRDPELGRD